MSCIVSSWQSSTWKLQTCGNNLKFTPFFLLFTSWNLLLSCHKQCLSLRYNCIWAHFFSFLVCVLQDRRETKEHSDTSWYSKASPGINILVHAIFVNTNFRRIIDSHNKIWQCSHFWTVAGCSNIKGMSKASSLYPISLIVHRLLTQSRLSFTKTQNYDQRLASIILFNFI